MQDSGWGESLTFLKTSGFLAFAFCFPPCLTLFTWQQNCQGKLFTASYWEAHKEGVCCWEDNNGRCVTETVETKDALVLQTGNFHKKIHKSVKSSSNLQDLHWGPVSFPDKKWDTDSDWVWILLVCVNWDKLAWLGFTQVGWCAFVRSEAWIFNSDP